jgi:hypothetical protein
LPVRQIQPIRFVKLTVPLKDLSLLGLDFSLEVTGFEVAEIDLRIASFDDMPEQDDDPADAVPEVSAEPPISQIGDLWLLGRHRVLCGNASILKPSRR